MYREKLESIHAALGELCGKLADDDAQLLRNCRANLLACAEGVGCLEATKPVSNAETSACTAA